ncbi:hypothetical protein ACJMK2_034426 [Sinanodonta woodiana]|uniref:Uncharacterized protein n=1 Tax=Sinanodonta woodiana TaxID=1069815 RepID=A0ABD3WSZ5_SINWO
MKVDFEEVNCHCPADLSHLKMGYLISSEYYVQADSGTQINPNQFEPYVSNTEESEAADKDYEEERRDTLSDSSWKLCNCGYCLVMQFVPGIQCTTHHPLFSLVCLDIHALMFVYYQY